MIDDRKVAAFHIGAHKTGTSVLQRYLRDHASTLDDEGLLVLGRRDLGQYIGWGRTLVREPERLTARLAEFARDERHDVLFGSNENAMGRPFTPRGGGRLYPRGPHNIAALAKAMDGDYLPRIFLSIRPQTEFLESYYLQSIHEGGSLPFDQWLEKVDVERLSWRPLVRALHRSFGRENVEVVDFRAIRAGQSEYVRRFLAQLHPRFDRPVTMTDEVNRSISDKGLRLALAANPLLPERSDRGALRRFLQQHFSNVDYPRPVLFTVDQRRELDDRYGVEFDDLVGGAPATTPASPRIVNRRPAPAQRAGPASPDPGLARKLLAAMNEHLDTTAERTVVQQFVMDHFGPDGAGLRGLFGALGRRAAAHASRQR